MSPLVVYVNSLMGSSNYSATSNNMKLVSFYRSFNAILGKVGRLAAEPVTVELLKSKCLPSLY